MHPILLVCLRSITVWFVRTSLFWKSLLACLLMTALVLLIAAYNDKVHGVTSDAPHSDTKLCTSASPGHTLADQLRTRSNAKLDAAKTTGSSAITTIAGGVVIPAFATCTPGHFQEPTRSKELNFVRQSAPSKLLVQLAAAIQQPTALL
jgi:hypothetical protein